MTSMQYALIIYSSAAGIAGIWLLYKFKTDDFYFNKMEKDLDRFPSSWRRFIFAGVVIGFMIFWPITMITHSREWKSK